MTFSTVVLQDLMWIVCQHVSLLREYHFHLSGIIVSKLLELFSIGLHSPVVGLVYHQIHSVCRFKIWIFTQSRKKQSSEVLVREIGCGR